jgi:hypothetical protein
MVTTSTTHPAFASLFHQLFDEFGHVYEYPMYEEEKGYKWRLAVRLDNSFQFLLTPADRAIERFSVFRALFLNWLAGIMDSEGNINLANSNGYARLILTIYNTDLRLLRSIKRALENFGYHPVGPYLQSPKGKITPGWNLKYTHDMWRLQLERNAETRSLLLELPLRHSERIRRKNLSLSINSRQTWKDVEGMVSSLRHMIRAQVTDFVKLAEEHYARRITERLNRK